MRLPTIDHHPPKPWLRRAVIAALHGALMTLFLPAFSAQAVQPLPRIKARSGSPQAEFYNTQTGQKFRPVGTNYVILRKNYHVNLNVGLYDPDATEAALSQMESWGNNVVRLWIDYGWPDNQADGYYGASGPIETDTPDLYQPYLDNLIDFLRRCTAHHIYAILDCDGFPSNHYYYNLISAEPNIDGYDSVAFLNSTFPPAKSLYLQELVGAVGSVDGGALLSTVFSWEIRNEIYMFDTDKPWSMTSGTVTTADGQTYDMADATSRQQCADNNVSNFMNTVAQAIRQVDPDAMVAASVFTFYAVGLNGPNGLMPGTAITGRHPARPLKLMNDTTLSYIDIHAYLHETTDLAADLESSELSQLDLTQKPLMMGEFGAPENYITDLPSAASALYNWRETAYGLGFSGALLWTYDTQSQSPHYWAATDQNGYIGNLLGLTTARLSTGGITTTNGSPVPVTVTFNRPVTGFSLADIGVSNGSATNLTGSGANYTFDLVPAGSGNVTVVVGDSVAQDPSGNGNAAVVAPLSILNIQGLPLATWPLAFTLFLLAIAVIRRRKARYSRDT